MTGRSPRELEEWTWGEVLLAVRAFQKGERQRYQALSVIAWREAALMAGCLAGERMKPVYELFPFWEEEEIRRLRLESYRSMMEGMASGSGRKERQR